MNFDKAIRSYKKSPSYGANKWFNDRIEEKVEENVAFILIKAKQGAGKTLTAVNIALNMFIKNGRKIVSNTPLNLYYKKDGSVGPHPESVFLDDVENQTLKDKRAYLFMPMDEIMELPKEIEHSILILDEIHEAAHSRRSNSKANEIASYLEGQYRKRNLFILATTQFANKLDVNFRQSLTGVIDMIHKKEFNKEKPFRAENGVQSVEFFGLDHEFSNKNAKNELYLIENKKYSEEYIKQLKDLSSFFEKNEKGIIIHIGIEKVFEGKKLEKTKKLRGLDKKLFLTKEIEFFDKSWSQIADVYTFVSEKVGKNEFDKDFPKEYKNNFYGFYYHDPNGDPTEEPIKFEGSRLFPFYDTRFKIDRVDVESKKKKKKKED